MQQWARLRSGVRRVVGRGGGVVFLVMAAGWNTGCVTGADLEAREAARPRPVVTVAADQAPLPGPVDKAADAEEALPVGGLVGQIAGKPIYAHHVLEGLEPELTRIGRRQPRPAFRQQARDLVLRRIQEMVQDRLFLDEAERALTSRERQGLDRVAEAQRNDLIRRFGRGSAALADRTLQAERGLTLVEMLRVEREQLILGAYQSREIEPLINVTRRDIERYYRDHEAEFNPPDQRTVRVIYTTRPEDADWFKSQLDAGAAFAKLAQDPKNQSRSADTAMEVASDDAFGDALAPKLRALEAGQWAGPVLVAQGRRYYFVEVDTLTRGVKRPLSEVQIEIERTLRGLQRQALGEQRARHLRRNASVTEEQRMADAVTAIAEARFASGGGG